MSIKTILISTLASLLVFSFCDLAEGKVFKKATSSGLEIQIMSGKKISSDKISLMLLATMKANSDLELAVAEWTLPKDVELISGLLKEELGTIKEGDEKKFEITVTAPINVSGRIYFSVYNEESKVGSTASTPILLPADAKLMKVKTKSVTKKPVKLIQ